MFRGNRDRAPKKNIRHPVGGGEEPDVQLATIDIVVLVVYAIGIFALYLLVVMGFLRGTPGPNQYGPDPLAGSAPATA